MQEKIKVLHPYSNSITEISTENLYAAIWNTDSIDFVNVFQKTEDGEYEYLGIRVVSEEEADSLIEMDVESDYLHGEGFKNFEEYSISYKI